MEPSDLFEAHIGGMDVFAAGLLAASRIIAEGKLAETLKERYSSFDSGEGRAFEEGRLDLRGLASLAEEYGNRGRTSGRQERLENLVNRHLLDISSRR